MVYDDLVGVILGSPLHPKEMVVAFIVCVGFSAASNVAASRTSNAIAT